MNRPMNGKPHADLCHVTAENATESETHRWCIEASDLGLFPGQWPAQIPTTLGNGQPFVRGAAMQHHGEFAGYTYQQSLGCITLTVFND